MNLIENRRAGATVAPVRLALVALLCLICACSSDKVPDTRYQLGRTQPGAAANPKAAADSPTASSGPFAQWAAVIVAGDSRSSEGGVTQAFDNARRDVAAAFVKVGFASDHIAQFSSNPKTDDPTAPGLANIDSVRGALHRLLFNAGEGCLIYVTSHGSIPGIRFGEKVASPADIAGLADRTCGQRPTILILSACHSGVFLQPVSAPNRLVMTAARADRSSFGCGTSNKYPYFDQCMIETLPTAPNFIVLTERVKACVARTEQAGHFTPPSEPQLSIGASIGPLLAQTQFAKTSTTAMMKVPAP